MSATDLHGYTFLDLKPGDSPLVLSIPHGGTDIPSDSAGAFNETGLAVPDTDWWMARLYGLADDLKPTVLQTSVSRYVIDVNRDPSGVSLYPGQATTALCPTTTFDGDPIYRPGAEPDAAEIARRRARYFDPYHALLAETLAAVRDQHGYALLYDCHSIRSVVPRLFDGVLPVFNIGTNSGASCAPEIEAAVVEACAAGGRSDASAQMSLSESPSPSASPKTPSPSSSSSPEVPPSPSASRKSPTSPSSSRKSRSDYPGSENPSTGGGSPIPALTAFGRDDEGEEGAGRDDEERTAAVRDDQGEKGAGRDGDRMATPSLDELTSHTANGRFKGGYITRHHGRPDQDIHAVQMELALRAYMLEAPPWTYDPAKATDTASTLHAVLKAMLAAGARLYGGST